MSVGHSMYREAGTVSVDEASCTRCGECARICPTEVLRLQEGAIAVVPESAFGCIACGHCMMVCPTGSVTVTGRGISPADLTPLPEPSQRADFGAMAALLRSRRSVRRFTAEEPSAGMLQRIVSLAASGPMGIPPWDVGCAVLRGRDRVQDLAEEVVKGYAGLLKVMKPWVLGLMRLIMKRPAHEQLADFVVPLGRSYLEGRKTGRDLLFYDAPALLVFHHSPYVDPSEAMIACTYAMLAAESMGLGTTMIGAAAPIIARNPRLSRKLGIPEGNRPAIALIVGFPAASFRRGVQRHFSCVTGLA